MIKLNYSSLYIWLGLENAIDIPVCAVALPTLTCASAFSTFPLTWLPFVACLCCVWFCRYILSDGGRIDWMRRRNRITKRMVRCLINENKNMSKYHVALIPMASWWWPSVWKIVITAVASLVTTKFCFVTLGRPQSSRVLCALEIVVCHGWRLLLVRGVYQSISTKLGVLISR